MSKSTAERRAYERERKRKYRARQKLKKQFVAPPTTALDIDAGLEWIQTRLRVPTGPLTSAPFKIYDWQEGWIRSSYADGIRQAGLSVARKNGKSGLIAALMLAHLAGPLNRANWRGVVTSMTAKLAKELQTAVMQTAVASDINVTLKRSPTPGVIYGENGARLDFIAADKSSGHAVGADIAIIDEMGLLQENKRGLVNAMFTSISGRNGKMFSISIQGDGPMFSELRAMSGYDSVHWRHFAAPADCALDDEGAWRAANPGMGTIKSYDYMVDSAKRAMNNPADQAFFRAYDLNQDLDPTRIRICSVLDWTRLYEDGARLENEPVALGIDLGGSVSMTAAVAIGLRTGILWSLGAFGGTPSLLDRGRNDGVNRRYQMMRERGELRVYHGRLVPVGQFLWDVLRELEMRGCRVEVIGADRYRVSEVYQVFDEVGYRGGFEPRGQGASATADGSADVRAFQRLVYSRGIRCEPSLMMEQAIAKSALRFDGAGNPALDKSESRGRIDALSAAVIAAGIYERARGPAAKQLSLFKGSGMVIVG